MDPEGPSGPQKSKNEGVPSDHNVNSQLGVEFDLLCLAPRWYSICILPHFSGESVAIRNADPSREFNSAQSHWQNLRYVTLIVLYNAYGVCKTLYDSERTEVIMSTNSVSRACVT